jgi:putative membrane protein
LVVIGLNPIVLAEWFHATQSGGWRLGLGHSAQDEAQTGMVLILTAQVLIVMLAQLLGRISTVRDILTPSWIKRQRVHQTALDQFAAQAMQETQARTGVLIYVSLREKQAEIVADSGIYTKVDQGVWRAVIQDLVTAARAGDLALGLVGAVEASTTILAPHFPPEAGDTDELSNKVILL